MGGGEGVRNSLSSMSSEVEGTAEMGAGGEGVGNSPAVKYDNRMFHFGSSTGTCKLLQCTEVPPPSIGWEREGTLVQAAIRLLYLYPPLFTSHH